MNFFIAGSAAIHKTVRDWVDRVRVNGGYVASPSGNTQRALSNFMIGLDNYGLTPKIGACCCFVPDNFAAATTPLIKVVGNDPWTNVNFAGSDLTIDGLKGDGTNGNGTKYLKTGILPSSCMTVSSGHLCVYIKEPVTLTIPAGNASNAWGASNATNNTRLYDYGYNLTIYNAYSDTAQVLKDQSSVSTGPAGYLMATRETSNYSAIYSGSNAIGHITMATSSGAVAGVPHGGTAANNGLAFFATNEGGTFYNKGNGRYSYASCGYGFTELESKIYFNLIQTMRQQLGGGYV